MRLLSGQTPMSKIKIFGLIGIICVLVLWVLYNFVVLPNTPNSTPVYNYFPCEVVSGEGYVSINVHDRDVALATTPSFTPTLNPTPIVNKSIMPVVSVTVSPTSVPGGMSDRVVYYSTPTPLPLPVLLGENTVYLDNWNYIKTHKLFVDYSLKQNLQVKSGDTLTFSPRLQNQADIADHLTVSVSASTLYIDPLKNFVVIDPTIIYEDHKIINCGDYVTISKTIKVPGVKGHYQLRFNVALNNGAYAEIMQEITVL